MRSGAIAPGFRVSVRSMKLFITRRQSSHFGIGLLLRAMVFPFRSYHQGWVGSRSQAEAPESSRLRAFHA